MSVLSTRTARLPRGSARLQCVVRDSQIAIVERVLETVQGALSRQTSGSASLSVVTVVVDLIVVIVILVMVVVVVVVVFVIVVVIVVVVVADVAVVVVMVVVVVNLKQKGVRSTKKLGTRAMSVLSARIARLPCGSAGFRCVVRD